MSPAIEKRLEISVVGVGKVNVIRDGSSTIVIGNGIRHIQDRHYLMPYEDAKEMLERILNKFYPDNSRLRFPRYK